VKKGRDEVWLCHCKAPRIIDVSLPLHPGDFADVIVDDTDEHDMWGRL
jgi:hypothetical protein